MTIRILSQKSGLFCNEMKNDPFCRTIFYYNKYYQWKVNTIRNHYLYRTDIS